VELCDGSKGREKAPSTRPQEHPMTTPSAIRHIPLDKLVPSPTNVRKTPS
jgi:hypothetical protein